MFCFFALGFTPIPIWYSWNLVVRCILTYFPGKLTHSYQFFRRWPTITNFSADDRLLLSYNSRVRGERQKTIWPIVRRSATYRGLNQISLEYKTGALQLSNRQTFLTWSYTDAKSMSMSSCKRTEWIHGQITGVQIPILQVMLM